MSDRDRLGTVEDRRPVVGDRDAAGHEGEAVALGETLIQRRLERVEYQTIGMNKSLTDAERLDTEIAAALSAQQKSIGDLYNQLAEIRRFRPPQ